jgi:hypothetical protein
MFGVRAPDPMERLLVDLPDRRQIYVRRGPYGWCRVFLQDLECEDFFAVIEDKKLSPNDVTLYVATDEPYENESGRWTIPVMAPQDVRKTLDSLD